MNASNKKNHRIVRVLLPLLLVLLLPLFIWVITTQRFEVRKKAASGEVPTNNPISWMTPYVSLTADNFYIRIGKINYTSTKNKLTLHSDPGNPNYKTLEAIWYEFNPEINDTVEMRMFIYFKSDGLYWWSDEIRTYNGNKQGDWIYYRPISSDKPFFKTLNGRPFIAKGDTRIASTPIGAGYILFTNLRLHPFFASYCFDDIRDSTDSTTAIREDGYVLPRTEMEVYRKWIEYGRPILPGCQPCIPLPILSTSGCSKVDGCLPNIPTLETNRYYCPPEPLPTESCVGRKNGTPCSDFVCPVCPPGGKCIMLACTMQYGNCYNQKCVIPSSVSVMPTPTRMPPEACPLLVPPAPGSNCKIVYPVCIPEDRCCPIIVCPTITKPPVITPIYITPIKTPIPPSPTPIAGIGPKTISILFRFASVTDARVTNGQVKIGVVTPTSELWTPLLKATPMGTTGIYSVSFALPQALDPTKLYRFIIKGEKHIASKICRQNGQTQPCGLNEWITVPKSSSTYSINYVNRPIEPGDVAPQDNVTNKIDFNRVVQAAAKLSSKQTDQDKLVGDLDYNNVVDLSDIGLMRKSLETRPDEN